MLVKSAHGRGHLSRPADGKSDDSGRLRLHGVHTHIIGNICHDQFGHDADAEACLHHDNRREVINNMIAGGNIQMILFEIVLDIGVRRLTLHHEAAAGHLRNRHALAGFLFFIVSGHNAKKGIPVKWLNGQILCAGGREKAEIHDAVFDPVDNIVIGSLKTGFFEKNFMQNSARIASVEYAENL